MPSCEPLESQPRSRWHLSWKPWRAEAIARLAGSVAVCILIGSLAVSMAGYGGLAHPARPILFFAASGAAAGVFVIALVILGRPWRPGRLIENLLGLLCSAYAGFFLMWCAARWGGPMAQPQSPTLKTIVAVLSFQGAALVLVQRFLREHQIGWAEAFGWARQNGRALLAGCVAAPVFLVVAWGLQYLSSLGLEALHIQPQEQETVHILRASEAWVNRIVIGAAALAIAPVAEEILFRGILYPAIKQRGFPRLALWGTALLFGAIHANAATFLPLTALALGLALLYEWTDNLLACILAHSLFNAANFIALLLMQR